MSKEKYIIGIDLGTTNSTLAYARLEESNQEIKQFAIPQIVSSGIQGESFSLPSFIYFPLKEEVSAKAVGIEWDPSRELCVGIFARDRGAELPSRLISSSKSWLCNSGIDRREKILPKGAESDREKMSPLQACAELLRHLRESWDVKMPKAPFQKQQIFITVPASFDPSARQLIQEAATIAGYPETILLEEPQAAFYAWIHAHEQDWRQRLKVGDSVLVVDIGGGTTDFSLINVDQEDGNLVLRRRAVGSHLLLGGDNIDLGLAYFAQNKLEEQGHTIDDWQFQSLIHACRQAKEQLLGDQPPDQVEVAIMGRGSRLIGGTLVTQITKNEIFTLIIDGFIPVVSFEERSLIEKRSGIQQVGLPYAQDARISCQLAKFLSMTGESDNPTHQNFVIPTAVLFNGGTVKAAELRKRLLDVINGWAANLNKEAVKEFSDPDYDFAVSRGAVYYGLARQGKGIRIRSGTARSYYIGVEEAAPAVPGFATPLRAVCIVPFGMEEGTEQQLDAKEFSLVLGELAAFRFFSHATPQLSNGVVPEIGTVVKNWRQELTELHPIETVLEKNDTDGKIIRVKLKSKVTELGVLELWCEAHDGRKWKLEFDIRQEKEEAIGVGVK